VTRRTIVQVLTSGDAGGGQLVAIAIGRALAERGHTVRFTSPSHGSLTSGIIGKFEVDIVRENSLRDLPLVHRIAAYLNRVNADLVHSHTPIASALLWRIGAAIAGVRIVHHFHAANFYGPRGIRSFLARKIDAATRFIPRFNIAVSENTRAGLIQDGYPADRVATIYNGMRHPRGLRVGARPQDPIVVCVGRLSPMKGQSELVEAFGSVRSLWPRAKLWIVGSAAPADAEYEITLRAHCEAAGLEDAVRFWGFRDDVDALVRRASLLVLPSHEEAFPLVLLEAMSVGIPVVATNVGGVSELVRNGETGILVETADPQELAQAILDVLGSAETSEQLSAAAYNFVWEKFGDAATLAPTIQVLERELRADSH
jgi:glycosyltransferase involved in cell wall biosynthesis